ncbi:MAG: hypothetical protein WBA73_13965 [Devosia sp.]
MDATTPQLFAQWQRDVTVADRILDKAKHRTTLDACLQQCTDMFRHGHATRSGGGTEDILVPGMYPDADIVGHYWRFWAALHAPNLAQITSARQSEISEN